MKIEGFRAVPYNDSVGHATIGYRTLLHKGNVTAEDKKIYPVGISEEEEIDQFGSKNKLIFNQTNCKCKKEAKPHELTCNGFGNGRYKNEYHSSQHVEAYHDYEYPGIHRSVLWCVRGLIFYLKKEKLSFHFSQINDGYRCKLRSNQMGSGTTNHRGKALDLGFTFLVNGEWHKAKLKQNDELRNFFLAKINGQIKWLEKNKFAFEPGEDPKPHNAAPNWVHIDARSFDSKYLNDNFFANTDENLNGSEFIKYLEQGN